MSTAHTGPDFSKIGTTTDRTVLPTDSEERKNRPIATGVLDYFPAALAEVARLSKIGNDKHNPGEPLHHARGKSSDHADTIVRHLIERGTVDTDGVRHSVKVAWRALALLQEELELEEGAPLPRGARLTVLSNEPGPAYESCALPPVDLAAHYRERNKVGALEQILHSPYSNGRSQR